MQDSARNIAKTIPTDFATAGSAVGEVNTRFHLTGQSMRELVAIMECKSYMART